MPPRIPLRPRHQRPLFSNAQLPACPCRRASVVTKPAAPPDLYQPVPIHGEPPAQPRPHKHPTLRKSQLHRQYQSLLHSSPILLIFQHNNLRAAEWAAIRAQVTQALSKVDKALESPIPLAGLVRIHVLHNGVFESALKVVEFWDPPRAAPKTKAKGSKKRKSAARSLVQGLSEEAWRESKRAARTRRHGLEAILSGPLAAISFPSVSPEHVAAALSILSPGERFPAPKRRVNPEYFEPDVQYGLQKLMLLGARVEGRAMDHEAVQWVGGIQGGLTGLRSQLVGLLNNAGVGLVQALEGAGKSLWLTMESRRMDLAGEGKEGQGEAGEGAAGEQQEPEKKATQQI